MGVVSQIFPSRKKNPPFQYPRSAPAQVTKISLLAMLGQINRGGASEASVATLTGDVDGSSRYNMYHTCVKPLGQLLHAHAQMVLSQQILKLIFTRKGNAGKKRSVAQEWTRTWV